MFRRARNNWSLLWLVDVARVSVCGCAQWPVRSPCATQTRRASAAEMHGQCIHGSRHGRARQNPSLATTPMPYSSVACGAKPEKETKISEYSCTVNRTYGCIMGCSVIRRVSYGEPSVVLVSGEVTGVTYSYNPTLRNVCYEMCAALAAGIFRAS